MKFVNEQEFENQVAITLSNLNYFKKEDNFRIDNVKVMDLHCLKRQIIKINNCSNEMANLAINEVKKISDDLIPMNIKATQFLVEGVKIFDSISKITKSLKLISTKKEENKFEYFRQMPISNGINLKIPDIVIFINGLPISVIELKSSMGYETLEDAHKQIQTYQRFQPNLFIFNIFNLLSNDIRTKYGSLTSHFEKYFGWNKNNDKANVDPFHFLYNQQNLLDLLFKYSYFTNENKAIKYIAAPHQILAITKTLKVLNINDNKGGVVWHTQGSGKSITMLMLTRAIITQRPMATILIITDRISLHNQIYDTFSKAETFLRIKPLKITSRKDLTTKLNDKKYFGVFFSTMQKFAQGTKELSNRDDVFILVDEAHRTQNNVFGEKVLDKKAEVFITKYGFAKYMRTAFPNAKITGFTATPLIPAINYFADKSTIKLFGDYNHVYPMNEAIKDNVIVPIKYQTIEINVQLDKKQLQIMDQIQATYRKNLNPNDLSTNQKLKKLEQSINQKFIFENPKIIFAKTQSILKHLQKRAKILHGKAMIVVNSRKAAFQYYKSIKKIDENVFKKTILVMTKSNKDSKEMEQAIVPRENLFKVQKEFSKDNSKYQIVIVVDMWLTGVDIPDLDVMYMDKIIKWHNLIQAITRVNRTYQNKKTGLKKESGLIVDYLGIWKYIVDALKQYATGPNETIEMEVEEINKAKEKLIEALAIINDNYIRNILQFPKLKNNQQYKFIMQALDNLLILALEEKNKFIKLAKHIKSLFKMSYTILDQKEITIAKVIEVTNGLLRSSALKNDENLILTIKQIKVAIKNAIDPNATKISVLESKGAQNISQVAQFLEKEAEELKKINPQVAIKLLKSALLIQIDDLKQTRPHFSEKMSERLKKIIKEIEKQVNIEKYIKMLQDLAKEIQNKKEEAPEFYDRHLQAFFTILTDDDYLPTLHNSEVIKQIANDLMQSTKANITEQFYINPKAKTKVKVKLINLLKNKYNYPPEHLGGISGILINKINKTISINPEYFIKNKWDGIN